MEAGGTPSGGCVCVLSLEVLRKHENQYVCVTVIKVCIRLNESITKQSDADTSLRQVKPQ